MHEFYIIIARKIFFPNFMGARAPLPPVSYAYGGYSVIRSDHPLKEYPYPSKTNSWQRLCCKAAEMQEHKNAWTSSSTGFTPGQLFDFLLFRRLHYCTLSFSW